MFAQMYEKMIHKQIFFNVQYVIMKKQEWNWLRFSIDCWCSVMLYLHILKNSSFQRKHKEQDIFQSEPPFTFIVSNSAMCFHSDQSYTGDVWTNI